MVAIQGASRSKRQARQIASGSQRDSEVIVVDNLTNRDVTLYSFDNDSIHVPGKAVGLPISKKFEWQMPSTIHVHKEQVVSTNEPIEHKSNLEEAVKRAQARRGKDFNILVADKVEGKEAIKDVLPPKNATVDDDKATNLRPNTSEKGVSVMHPNGPVASR